MMRLRPPPAPILATALAAVTVAALAAAVTGITGRSDPPRDAVAGESRASALRDREAARDWLLEREPGLAQARAEWGRDFYFTRAIYS
ncbi:MAG: hypothetical protein F4164_11150, partial [Gemmatimonadales bacterium]|nr:hypothetical protein [Gemmatimonadales bacterium]